MEKAYLDTQCQRRTQIMTTLAQFEKMFSLPREPETLLIPGQHFSMTISKNNKVVITDIYIENLGGGTSWLYIQQQTGPNNFEIRYRFRTTEDQATIINFTTGLRLGDESPIEGSIRIVNSERSQANVLPRINGVLVA
jgi:hypothetical protein